MCLAYPGKVKKINSKTVIVKYPTEEREVIRDTNIPIKVGDYVMVQMGIVISKVNKKEALESQKEWE